MRTSLIVASLLLLAGAGCAAESTTDTSVDAGTSATMPVIEEDGTTSDAEEMVVEGEDDPAGATIEIDVGADGTANIIVGDAAEPTVREFAVTGNNFAFSETSLTVKKGDTVRIVFTNAEGFHDWKIDEFNAATQKLSAGASETIEFVADTAGSFEYYCSVGSHRAMGMKGTLVVEE